MKSFVAKDGIVARNLVEERTIAEEIFQDFVYNPQTAAFVAKTEKKIVEFMTGTIPRNQHRVQFECPQNLLDQFIYDETTFKITLDASETVGYYDLDLKVDGALKGVKLDLFWECIGAKRSYIEIDAARQMSKSRFSKILVIDLEKIGKLVQLFDELGIKKLDNLLEKRPLWNLATIDPKAFDGLPVEFEMKPKLLQIRSQMLGETRFESSADSQRDQRRTAPLSGRRGSLARAAAPDVSQRHSRRRYGAWQNPAGDRGDHPASQQKQRLPFADYLSDIASLQLERRAA